MYTEKKNSCLFNFNKIFSTHFFLRQHMEKIDKRGLLPEIYEKTQRVRSKICILLPNTKYWIRSHASRGEGGVKRGKIEIL